MNYNDSSQYGLMLHIIEPGSQRPTPSRKALIATLGSEITFDMSSLDTYNYEGWKPIHYDLLVACAAVEFADRTCTRRSTQWARSFKVTLPVLDLACWQRREVQEHLNSMLRHLTGDNWHFSFVQSKGSILPSQRSLPFGSDKEYVIAYSDGLDSRCVSILFDKVVRVRVAEKRDALKRAEGPFDRIPFKVKPHDSHGESSVRSRGFKFAAITAIAAHLSNIGKIIVPESGQGAFGPVLLPLHNIYADYRNHPTFFRKMESFINVLLNYSLKYEQPRLWNTKGQTILDSLNASGNKPDSLFETRSCWQQRWNVRSEGKLRQCGLCAACLLRRMSMHAAGVHEPSNSYVMSDLTAKNYKDAVPKGESIIPSKTMIEYGSVGARHLQQLANMATLPVNELQVHAFEIGKAMNITQVEATDKLIELLAHHATEWNSFIEAQGKHSFLKRWIEGGR